MNDTYIPYGPEWEKEVSKLPKKILVEMLRKSHLKREAAEELIGLVCVLNEQALATYKCKLLAIK